MSEEVHNHSPRHLVLLIDGTWVSASQKKPTDRLSNIYNLNMMIKTSNAGGEAQVAFYQAGVGSKTAGDRFWGGAFGRGLERQVEEAYVNLISNYNKGDKLYVFGFSRGAIVARVVSDIISKFGVLKPQHIDLWPIIWGHYLSRASVEEINASISGRTTDEVGIEFLGVFDTVLGQYWAEDWGALKENVFSDRLVPSSVKYALHILSLHETRGDFQPVLWSDVANDKQELEQIWMPGVHTDIGGGYERDFMSRVSLVTMLDRLGRKTDIGLYSDRIDEIKKSISMDLNEAQATQQANKVVINDERSDLSVLWNILPSAERLPGGSDKFQYFHPICEEILNRLIVFKSEQTQVPFTMARFSPLSYVNIGWK